MIRKIVLLALASLASLGAFAGTASAFDFYVPTYFGPADNVYGFSAAGSGTLAAFLQSPYAIGAAPARGLSGIAFTPDPGRAVAGYSFNGGIQPLTSDTNGRLNGALPVVGTHAGESVAVSPDGRFVYQGIGSATQGIDGYSINPNGSLTALAGSPFFSSAPIGALAIEPDGTHLYAVDNDAIRTFAIAADGALTAGPALAYTGADKLVMAPDGRHLLVSTSPQHTLGSVAISPGGSITTVGTPVVVGSTDLGFFAVSPDSRRVYASDYNGTPSGSYAIDVLEFNADGSLALQSAAPTGIYRARTILVSPDNHLIYAGDSGAGKVIVASLDANGVPGSFRAVADAPTGEDLPWTVRPERAAAADFRAAPTRTPLKMHFEYTGSIVPEADTADYLWDFGDSRTAASTVGYGEHDFPSAGVYSVTLEAKFDGCGATTIYSGTSTVCTGLPAAKKTIAVDTPPWIRSLKVSPSTLRSNSRIRFKLTEPAKVTFNVERLGVGRSVAGLCRHVTRTNKRHAKCRYWGKTPRKLVVRGKSGRTNSVRFAGRIKGRRLAKGSYRFSAVPVDHAGQTGLSSKAYFKIKR